MLTEKNENVGRLLRQASSNLTKKLDEAASHYGLTSQQMSIIDFLYDKRDEKIIQMDVERELKIRRSTTTTLLQRMEEKKLITREAVKSDKRQKTLNLTDEALSLVKIIKNYTAENDKRLLSNLTESEISAVKKFLKKVVKENQ